MSTETDRDEEVLTPSEAAKLLRVNVATLRQYPREELPWFETPGGHRRYLRTELIALQTRNR